jgi:poly [ADP-ribose] polymerase
MEEAVKEMKYDTNKAPLGTLVFSLTKPILFMLDFVINFPRGKERFVYRFSLQYIGRLTKEQIKAGYSALKAIDQCISKGDFGSKLVAACDAFYTRIPHCFG